MSKIVLEWTIYLMETMKIWFGLGLELSISYPNLTMSPQKKLKNLQRPRNNQNFEDEKKTSRRTLSMNKCINLISIGIYLGIETMILLCYRPNHTHIITKKIIGHFVAQKIWKVDFFRSIGNIFHGIWIPCYFFGHIRKIGMTLVSLYIYTLLMITFCKSIHSWYV